MFKRAEDNERQGDNQRSLARLWSPGRRAELLKLLLAVSAACLLAASCSGAFVSIVGPASFGLVRPGYSGTRTFFVKNDGGVDAKLGQVTSAGLGLSAPFALTGGSCTTGYVLPASGTCTLEITFSPTAEGTASSRIQLVNHWTDSEDDLPRTAIAEFAISGTGGDGVSLSGAPVFDFGAYTPVTQDSRSFQLTNNGAPAITLGDMSAAALGLDSVFELAGTDCTTGMTLAAYGGRCSIVVNFRVDAVGTYSDIMTVHYAPAGSSEQDSVTLELRGVGASLSLSVTSPDGDAFGAVALGSSKTKRYTVKNDGNVDLYLTLQANMNLPFSISATTCVGGLMRPGATCTTDITFAPTELGPYQAFFFTGYSYPPPHYNPQVVSKTVTGGGGDPLYFANADFGAPPVGSTVVTPVAVTNVHTVPLTLGTVSAAALGISAPYVLQSTTCASGAVLEPNGGNCTLKVAFSPVALGGASGNVKLAYSWNDGAAHSKTTTGTLTGSGASLRRIKQVAVGKTHKCALFEDGGMRCWGESTLGALGFSSYPFQIGDDELPSRAGDVEVGGSVAQISAGDQITCALLTTGTVRCWGNATYLGYGRELPLYPRPVNIGDIDVGGPVKQIVTGTTQTCALLTTGNVRCWGEIAFRILDAASDPANFYSPPLGYPGHQRGVIGDDETPASVGDINVGGEVSQITAGDGHVCALLTTGKVRCWGDGQFGQLGYGNKNAIGDDEQPAAAGDVNVGGQVVRLSAGTNHTCALLTTGAVRCWGEGTQGALGYGNTNSIGDDETPVSVGAVNIGGIARDVSAGDATTCALLDTGKVRCWGKGGAALGYGNTNNIGDDELPLSAGDVNVGGSVAQIVTEGAPQLFYMHENGTCAVLTSGTVRCWGLRYLGYPGITEPIGDDELPFTAGDIALQ
jgi:alpha-tubulin suppressor-like RCC1 family protein